MIDKLCIIMVPNIWLYGLEATPSILGLQIVLLAARRDDGGDYYGAHSSLALLEIITANICRQHF